MKDSKLAIVPAAALALAIMAASARLLFIELDPPYGIVSWSGTFLTDEGWWTKNAQLWAKFGDFRNPYDSNLLITNTIFTALLGTLFKITSPDLFIARYAAATASIASLLFIYLISRRSFSREVSAAVVLASAITLHQVTYARMAILEPFATLLSLIAIYFLTSPSRKAINQSLSLAFAVFAFLTKTTFVFTLVTVVTVLLIETLKEARAGRTRAAALTLVGICCWITVAAAIQLLMTHLFPEEAIVAAHGIGNRFEGLTFHSVLSNEFRAFSYAITSYHWRILFAAIFLVLLWTALAGPIRRSTTLPREVYLVMLWLLSGIVFFGAFKYQPPRYFYFVSFAVPFLAFSLLEVAGRKASRKGLSLTLIGLICVSHAATQLPAYRAWYWRQSGSSFVDMARLFVTRIDDDAAPLTTGEVVVMGPTSSFVSLFSRRIRPTEFSPIATFPVERSEELIGRRDDVCSRVAYWKPSYTAGPESKTIKLSEVCPYLVVRDDELARHTVMKRWYFDTDFVLRKVVYAAKGTVE